MVKFAYYINYPLDDKLKREYKLIINVKKKSFKKEIKKGDQKRRKIKYDFRVKISD